jgi:hypothetical protein
MEKLKKSEENIVNFIVNALGKPTEWKNGQLPKMTEMRNLTPGLTPSLTPGTSLSPLTTSSASSASSASSGYIAKIIIFLIILFIIYKLIEEYYPDIFVNIQTYIYSFGVPNINIPMYNSLFDTSNNLNSNQILDFLLGAKTSEESEWCYVGETNGTRFCTISQGKQCMSGNIFPSKDICVNPKLTI